MSYFKHSFDYIDRLLTSVHLNDFFFFIKMIYIL